MCACVRACTCARVPVYDEEKEKERRTKHKNTQKKLKKSDLCIDSLTLHKRGSLFFFFPVEGPQLLLSDVQVHGALL